MDRAGSEYVVEAVPVAGVAHPPRIDVGELNGRIRASAGPGRVFAAAAAQLPGDGTQLGSGEFLQFSFFSYSASPPIRASH
jgi:hypothetical protein